TPAARIVTLSLHDALPISGLCRIGLRKARVRPAVPPNDGEYDSRIARRVPIAGRRKTCRQEAFRLHEASRSALVHHADELVRLRSEEHTSELQSRENLVCR